MAVIKRKAKSKDEELRDKMKEIQGNISDENFARMGEIFDKQDLYSKTARKTNVVKKWLFPLYWYVNVTTFLSICCFAYTAWYFFHKPYPLYFYEYENGKIECAKTYITNHGKFVQKYTSKQKEVCDSLVELK